MTLKLIIRFTIAVVFVPLTIQILFLPLPQFAIRTLVTWSDDWILTDYTKSESKFSSVSIPMQKLLATLIEHNLIRQFESRLNIKNELSDVDKLIIELGSLKNLIINQHVIWHDPSNRPTFLTGLGWCDQLNGVAGRLLAINFPISQTFALVDPVNKKSPHTIGRVWSPDFNDWLYFDIFYDEIILFVRPRNEAVKYIARFNPQKSMRNLPPNDIELTLQYNMLDEGWVLNEYSPSFGGYLVKKALQAIKMRNLNSLSIPAKNESQYAMNTVKGRDANENMQNTNMLLPKDFVDTYLDARLAHIFGEDRKAKERYMDAINVPSSAIPIKINSLTQASYLFKNSLIN